MEDSALPATQPDVQAQTEPTAPGEKPEEEKPFMRQIAVFKHTITDNILWILFFLFTPLFFLIFLSQNTIPGNALYPVKRGVENVILAASSITPATKAFYRANLVDTRFQETEQALLARAPGSKTIDDFEKEMEAAQRSITVVSDPVKKGELQQKLIDNIDIYQTKLSQIQAQVAPPVPNQTAAQNLATGNGSSGQTQYVVNQYNQYVTTQQYVPNSNSGTTSTSQENSGTSVATRVTAAGGTGSEQAPATTTAPTQTTQGISPTAQPTKTPANGATSDQARRIEELKKRLDEIKRELEQEHDSQQNQQNRGSNQNDQEHTSRDRNGQ